MGVSMYAGGRPQRITRAPSTLDPGNHESIIDRVGNPLLYAPPSFSLLALLLYLLRVISFSPHLASIHDWSPTRFEVVAPSLAMFEEPFFLSVKGIMVYWGHLVRLSAKLESGRLEG